MQRNLERENLEKYLRGSDPIETLEKNFVGKLDVLARDYNVKTSHHLHWKNMAGYKGQEPSLLTLVDPANADTAFQALLRAVPRTVLALGDAEALLIDKKNSALIPIVVGRRRLVFANPYRSLIKAQIWQRWSIDQGKTDHNYGNKPSRTKSVFTDPVRHNVLLSRALAEPVGRLVSESELVLYLRWAMPIGELAQRKGQTDLIAVRCERRTRRVGQRITGSRISCHCYPISEKEVERDLRAAPQLLARLS
jgi:hypothetical protein